MTELIIYSTDSWVSTWTACTICCVKSAATTVCFHALRLINHLTPSQVTQHLIIDHGAGPGTDLLVS